MPRIAQKVAAFERRAMFLPGRYTDSSPARKPGVPRPPVLQ